MTRRDRAVYTVLMVLGVGSVVAFYTWWLQPAHYPDNFGGNRHLVDVAIFGALTLVMSHRVFMDLYAWVVARRIEPYVESEAPAEGLAVAFITTFVPGAEGIDLLQRTLPAMLRADYPHDVWLLDEGNSEEARALCEALGVHYFTRHGRPEYNWPVGAFTRRTKGGNHNSWYDAHGHAYDVVAQIDTDFLPRRDFLTQTLGHFRDPEVGWVTTPQIYGNTDRFVARGAAQQQFTFYGPILRGLSTRGMANMLGANHVVRVSALTSISFYAGHITEDLLTGMRLHAEGWRSVYVPLPLAVGEGPDTWKAYLDQQKRWAFGCIEILVHHTWRLTRTMPASWRWMYVALQQGYFSGVAAAGGIALLALYFLGGVEISRVPFSEFLVWAAPFFVMRHAVRLWLQRFNVRPGTERGLMLSGSIVAIAAWPVYLAATVRVLRQLDLGFSVTPKGSVRRARGDVRAPFTPHALLAALCVACLVAAYLTDRRSGVLIAWAVVNVVLMGGLWILPGFLERVRVRSRNADPAIAVLTVVPTQRYEPVLAERVAAVTSLPRQRGSAERAEPVTAGEAEDAG